MIILLYGEDTFRSRQKLLEIIKEYSAKHQTGLSLARFNEERLDFDEVKNKIEAVSMFDEKKLIVLENVFGNKDFQDDFLQCVKKNKLKENQDIIIVILHEGKLAVSRFKTKLSMLEEFAPLKGAALINWVKQEVVKNKAQINQGAINKLIVYIGNDLWRFSSEINKLANYKFNSVINEEDVDLLVKAKLDTNIFKTLDALAQRDKKTAFRLLREHLTQGENELYLFSMFVYQLRNLIKLKDLIEKGAPFYSLAKKSGLHPFVVRKSSEQIRNFSFEQLKKIYKYLLEIEIKLKTGRINGRTALDLLVAEI